MYCHFYKFIALWTITCEACLIFVCGVGLLIVVGSICDVLDAERLCEEGVRESKVETLNKAPSWSINAKTCVDK